MSCIGFHVNNVAMNFNYAKHDLKGDLLQPHTMVSEIFDACARYGCKVRTAYRHSDDTAA